MKKSVNNGWMIKMKHAHFIFVVLMCARISVADANVPVKPVDSETNDTIKINALNESGWELMYADPDTAILLSTQALHLSEKINWEKGKARSTKSLGAYYYLLGDYKQALNYFSISLEISQKINDKKGICAALANMGNVYKNQGNYEIALDYFFKALKMDQEMGDQMGISADLGNIGTAYCDQGDFPIALDYYFKALQIDTKIGNENGIMSWKMNIGLVYKMQQDYEKALKYYFDALEMTKRANDKIKMAAVYTNIGVVYRDKKDFQQSREYLEKAMEIDKEMGNIAGISSGLGNLGNIYLDEKEYAKALDCFFRAMEIDRTMGDRNSIARHLGNIGALYAAIDNFREAEKYMLHSVALCDSINAPDVKWQIEKSLCELYSETGRHKEALEHFRSYIAARDTIFSRENIRTGMQKELQFEYDKKAAEDSIKTAKDKEISDARILAQDEQLKREATERYTLYGGLSLFFVFGIMMYNRFRLTRKQKKIIESQKQLVEEKNHEILDSINYAKRIQNAILPPDRVIKKIFPDSFVLYKPKDIVAGDFYWFEKKDNILLFAVADCTGHGVPGAMVSVVCHNALNRSVREFGLTQPAQILDKCREMVIQEFGKSDEDVKDGMDISLCSYDTVQHKLKWAGANNPLWLMRNGKITEIKPDKQPIGKHTSHQPFNEHAFSMEQGDIIYIFSDGLQDQFGGEKGKKFKAAGLKALLEKTAALSMAEQSKAVNDSFENWKGALEQIDDVCIIGIKPV